MSLKSGVDYFEGENLIRLYLNIIRSMSSKRFLQSCIVPIALFAFQKMVLLLKLPKNSSVVKLIVSFIKIIKAKR